jgi:hypothetical protein
VIAAVRQALLEAGVDQGRVTVQVRRGHPAWRIAIAFYRPGQKRAALLQTVYAHGGHLSRAALSGLTGRAALALRGGGAVRAQPHAPRAKAQAPPAKKPVPPATLRPDQAQAMVHEETSPDEDRGPSPVDDAPEGHAATQPAAAPAAPATPTAVGASDLGFEVSEGESSVARRPAATVASRPRHEREPASSEVTPDDHLVVRLEAGIGLAQRRFILDRASSAVDYESGLYSQFSVQGEVYPLELFWRSPLARLGARLSYATSAGLSTEAEQPGTAAASLATSVQRWWAGLTYRVPHFLNPRLPQLDLRVGIAQLIFEVDDNPRVQDLSFTTFAAGGSIAVPLFTFLVLGGSGEYRMLLRARSPVVEQYASAPAALQGFTLQGTVAGRVRYGLGYRASFTYERLAGELSPLAGEGTLAVRDRFLSADLALTWEM